MLFERALKVYRDEGLLFVIRRAFAYIFHNVLSYETYYLIKIAVQDGQIKQTKRVDFADEITSKWIESNKQADEIAKEFEDFRLHARNAHRILNAGGIATCTYVGKELAGFGWIATNETAMKAMTDIPLYIDFENKEVYAGYAYTVPKYRRKGLRYYRLFFRYQMFKEKGLEVERSAINTSNYVSLKANSDRAEYMITARGRSFRIMGLSFWKETPMNVHAREIVDKMDG